MTASGPRTAIVSGGSRGIGRATVLRLVRDGFDVAFCYQRDAEAAATVEKEAVAAGGRAVARQVDVTDGRAVEEWVAATERELGPVDVAVCSAGVVRDTPLMMMGEAQWRAVLDTNLDGTFNLCRPAVFRMTKRRAGCVVTMSSVAGIAGNATQCNYAAAKAGIIGFTTSLSKEVGRYGIRANVVAPGFIETDMLSGLSDARRDASRDLVSLGRFGQAEEVADAVSYLVTAHYVTGTVLRVDGGLAL